MYVEPGALVDEAVLSFDVFYVVLGSFPDWAERKQFGPVGYISATTLTSRGDCLGYSS